MSQNANPQLRSQKLRPVVGRFLLSLSLLFQPAIIQICAGQARTQASEETDASGELVNAPSATVSRYVDPVQGSSSVDLVRRALTNNGELVAARLDINRARARLRQAGLFPNPTIDFEQTSERLTGAGTDRATSVGFSLPIELGGKRGRRIDLARAEVEAAEAAVADRERQLAGEVGNLYAEGLAAARELEITERINNIDLETARFVQARVTEGETAPLELNLLKVEVDRLRSRRVLVEGRLQAALIKLKSIVGIPANEPLRLREDLSLPPFRNPPQTIEAAIDIALRTRPDLKFARLEEEVAQAGFQLARAQAVPNVTLFTRYISDRTITDLPAPLVPVPNFSKRVAIGVSIGLPIFNRNQGGKDEAEAVISQTKSRREYMEQVVRAEVSSAYVRYEAARAALSTFEQGVLVRSNENVRTLRGAYEAGAYRITDLLVEQRRLVDSQREFTEALTEQYRALIDLNAAIGAALPAVNSPQ